MSTISYVIVCPLPRAAQHKVRLRCSSLHFNSPQIQFRSIHFVLVFEIFDFSFTIFIRIKIHFSSAISSSPLILTFMLLGRLGANFLNINVINANEFLLRLYVCMYSVSGCIHFLVLFRIYFLSNECTNSFRVTVRIRECFLYSVFILEFLFKLKNSDLTLCKYIIHGGFSYCQLKNMKGYI